jgi:oligopeptide transport system ATP-binding protein
MKSLKQKVDTSIVLITHDLGVVANMADRIYVMYAGKIVEHGTAYDIFKNPKHPYTKGLLGSAPRVDKRIEGGLIPYREPRPTLLLRLKDARLPRAANTR